MSYVIHLRWDVRAAQPESDELQELLEDGWEPFAVTTGTFTLIFLRKQVARRRQESPQQQDSETT